MNEITKEVVDDGQGRIMLKVTETRVSYLPLTHKKLKEQAEKTKHDMATFNETVDLMTEWENVTGKKMDDKPIKLVSLTPNGDGPDPMSKPKKK